MVRGSQFCTQLSVAEGSLAELLLFWWVVNFKNEGVSPSCFVFDIVKFKKIRQSRRLAAFLILRSKNEEVSQNSFVFELADRQTDRQIATITTATTNYTRLHYTMIHCSTLHYAPLHYTNYNYSYNCNYSTLITLQYNYSPTALHYNYSWTTPYYIQQLWVRWPLQPLQPLQKSTSPTTFRSISGYAPPSMHQNNSPLL